MHRRTTLRRCLPFALAALAATAPAAPPATASTARPDFPVTNGTVRASLLTGSTLYIGGDFSYVGPSTGHAVALDPQTGVARSSFPRIAGSIRAIASDGHGGWFVGGTLGRAGGLSLGNLVHIRADDSVDPSFAPRPDGEVDALLVSGGSLYVGGTFSTIGGAPRAALAALDPATGRATGWDARLVFDAGRGAPSVTALAASGGVVYVGGNFVAVGTTSARALVGLDPATAAVTWNPNRADYQSASSIAVANQTVYAGVAAREPGQTSSTSFVQALSAADARVLWQTSASARSFALAGGRLYAAGILRVLDHFDPDTGEPIFRSQFLYALDPATGTPLGWDPQADGANALTVLGDTLYAGGLFSTVKDARRGRLAAFDAASGTLLPWNPNGDASVDALATDGRSILAGGELNSVNGVDRDFFAAIDTATGRATDLDLGLNGSVTAIAPAGQTLFIAGGFGHADGQIRTFLAELDATTGRLTSWAPQAAFRDNIPYAIAADAGTLYVGGEFNSVRTRTGVVARHALAAFSRATGRLTNWDPSANGPVFTLALAGGAIYAGGVFQHIGLTPRNGVAAITPQGKATSWNANVQLAGQVYALRIVGGTVYLGGSFDTVAGQPRVDLAAVRTDTGALLPWTPNTTAPFGRVESLAVAGNTLYAGGDFLRLQERVGLAVFTADTGALTPFQADTNPGGEVAALAVDANGTLYAGGSFTDIAASDHENLAAITTD